MTDGVLHDLTVSDGSCRDINLFGVTGPGAERLLTWITSQFDSHVGDAYPSREEVEPIEAANFAGPMNAGYSVRGVPVCVRFAPRIATRGLRGAQVLR